MKHIIAMILALCLTVFLVSCLSLKDGAQTESRETGTVTDSREEESSSEAQTTAVTTEVESDSLPPEDSEENTTSRFPNEADPQGTKRY
ncbi:MAG: hypothetical protein IJX13_08485 [Clostridia bacterium]|nr:hypothetical protein [Clostridia bacterium]